MYHEENCPKSNSGKHKNNTKEIFEKVVNNLQNIVNNGEYEKFLKFQQNFRNYSFNNIVLIFSQYPDATRIARQNKMVTIKKRS